MSCAKTFGGHSGVSGHSVPRSIITMAIVAILVVLPLFCTDRKNT